jgi:tetrahydromethanopterin S-methyltransferase subunit G
MNPFQEAYQKALGEGLAKWTLRGIGILLLLVIGFLIQRRPIVAISLLAVATILTLLLMAYAFGWATSYRKTRQRVQDLEKRVDYHDDRQATEDKFFQELVDKTPQLKKAQQDDLDNLTSQ